MDLAPVQPPSLLPRLLVRGLCLLPLLLAGYYVFINPSVSYVRRIDLRAPGGTVEWAVEHGLVELRDRAVMLSGVPEKPPQPLQQGPHRLQLLVRKSPGAAAIYDKVMEPPLPDRVVIYATLPAGAPMVLNVDSSWQTDFDTRSDYGHKVWRRLWVLLLGLALSVGLVRLLHRRGAERSAIDHRGA